MARPRKTAPPQLSAGQASYVLNRLVQERRISAADVSRYVSDMSREIDDLEKRLAALRAAHGAGAGTSAPARRRRPGRPPAAAPAAKAPGKRRRPRRAITAEQLASRKLQGRYLGLVRQFPPNRRAYFAKVAKDKGREAAIKEMLDTRK